MWFACGKTVAKSKCYHLFHPRGLNNSTQRGNPFILNSFFQLDLPCDTVVRLKRISEQCKFDFKCIELSDVFLSPDYIYRDISCAERAHSRQSLVFFCNLAYKTGLNNLLSGFHSNSYKAEIVSILRMRLLTLVAQSLGYCFISHTFNTTALNILHLELAAIISHHK